MKKLFMLTCLLFGLTIGTELCAQNKSVFLHKQETMDALSLNPEQQAQITKLTNESFSDITKLKKDTALTDSERKTKISGVYRARDESYKKTLTESQWKKLLEMRQAAKNSN
jgi:Spy/CpxP family protein refolding chaperone